MSFTGTKTTVTGVAFSIIFPAFTYTSVSKQEVELSTFALNPEVH